MKYMNSLSFKEILEGPKNDWDSGGAEKTGEQLGLMENSLLLPQNGSLG